MSLRDLLETVAAALQECGISYMLTGSLAGSYHGAPRATQDIDLVVEGSTAGLLRLAEVLRGAGLYVSDEAVREARETQGMFNAIDPSTGWKVDFIIRKDRAFSREEFESRQEIEFQGLRLNLACAEDMVVAKLEWASLGESERQLRDVAEILNVQGADLDLPRIETWITELGLDEEWAKARELADSSGESG